MNLLEQEVYIDLGGQETPSSPTSHLKEDIYIFVSWCGGELWVDQRIKCADICDVAQVTDIRTLPN